MAPPCPNPSGLLLFLQTAEPAGLSLRAESDSGSKRQDPDTQLSLLLQQGQAQASGHTEKVWASQQKEVLYWSTQPVGWGVEGCQGLERGHRTEEEARVSWVSTQAEMGLGLDPVSTVLINSLPWACLLPLDVPGIQTQAPHPHQASASSSSLYKSCFTTSSGPTH